MAQLTRFGRKIALPSTRQIRHEILVSMQEEARLRELKKAAADAPSPEVVKQSPPSTV